MPRRHPVLLALAVTLAATGAMAQPDRLPLDRSDPDHLRPPGRPIIVPEVIPRRTQFVRPRMVYTLPDGLGDLVKPDPALSELCRLGAFVQEMDGYYWAQARDRRYGVAFPTGHNLIDAQNRRKPGKVYFFQDQDSRCVVYVGDQRRLARHYIRD